MPHMEGIFINGEKAKFHPEDILDTDASQYTEEIGTATKEWLSENLTPESAGVVDKTLSIEGAAADAKETGNRISELKSDLNILNDSIDYIVDGTLVKKYSIPLGTTNTKTLVSSVYLTAGKYTLTYTQMQTMTSNSRNTAWWSPTGGTKSYKSVSTDNNLSSGTYDWNITIPSDGYYDFGLWVNTPNIEVDYTNFYLHNETTVSRLNKLDDEVDELDKYTKKLYQSVDITGAASTNIIKPFCVQSGDVITVINNGSNVISAYTCTEDGTNVETISASIKNNSASATITATQDANYIKIWSSGAVNAIAQNKNSVFQNIIAKDEEQDNTLKILSNNISVETSKSGNLYIPYNFSAGTTYVITNNSTATCSLTTCDSNNAVVDSITSGLASNKSFEFVATGDATQIRVWSSITDKKINIEAHSGLKYDNDHNISGPYVPTYYYSYLKNKLETVRALGSDVCINGEQFVFLTDYHDYKNAKQSPALVKYLFEKTGVKFIVFGGDNINLGNGYADVFDEIAQFFGDFNFLDRNQMIVVTGNHEHYSNVTTGYTDSAIPTHTDLYYSLMNQRSTWEVAVDAYGDYILANPLSKIYYCIFSCDYDAIISDDQLNAVADMVMDLEDGWHIMFIGHRFLMGDASVIANENLADMADAIASKSSVTINSVTHDFSTKNIDVLPLMSGHTHQDGMVRTSSGLPVIGTTTDAIELDLINTRTKGTVDEQAFDVVSLDMTNRVIYLTRIGAGSDRQYSY